MKIDSGGGEDLLLLVFMFTKSTVRVYIYGLGVVEEKSVNKGSLACD